MTAIEPIVDGIYPLVEPWEGRRLTVVLVVDEGEALLVDTGLAETPGRLVLPALAELGLEPAALRLVVITHSDVDHSGGLGTLHRSAPGAAAIAHRLDGPWIEDVEALIEQRYCGLREHGFEAEEEFKAWVRANDSGARIDVGVAGGETLRVGSRRLELVHVPGHSRGHLALVDLESATGLIGDAVFGRVTPMLDGSGAYGPGYYDVAAYRATIARLAALDLERIVGTHYPVLVGDEVDAFLDDSAAFCAELETSVLEALDGSGPLSSRAVVEAAAPAVRAWPPDADLALAAAVVGHLRDLADRGLVQPVPGSPVAWERT